MPNAQGKATALILDKDDVVQLRESEASKAIGDQWVVTSGLQAGDRVIVSVCNAFVRSIKAQAISSTRKTPAPNRNNNVAGLRDFRCNYFIDRPVFAWVPAQYDACRWSGDHELTGCAVSQIAPPTVPISATYPVPMRKR